MNVAFIPVRGGSKSIPLKNIKKMSGKPLVYWTAAAACECADIDAVYVATDSVEIRSAVEAFHLPKLKVVGRSRESATDTASTESAMLEFAGREQFDNIVLIQATSPLLRAEDLKRGFDVFGEPDTDSVLSVVRQKRFQWAKDENNNACPVNYDVYNRPRRQDFEGYFVENGAFYITSRERLIQSGNRISGRIKMVEMDEETFIEIDEPGDWEIVEGLMKKRRKGRDERRLQEAAEDIRIFLTDCDGCLTDGGMYYTEKGDELKKFNTRDGMGFSLLKQRGLITGIVTGEDTELVRRRAQKLGLDELHCGVRDKLGTVRKICEKYGCGLEHVAYVGDDINDLEVIMAVGLGCSVGSAEDEIKECAEYVSPKKGGDGAVRDIINKFWHN